MERDANDRHTASDTRFSRGMWELKNGVNIKWAIDNFKTEVIDSNKLYLLSASSKIRSRGDTLNNVTITSKIHSPSDGVIGFESYHHKSKYINSKEPRFGVHTSKSNGAKVSIEESQTRIVAEGDIEAKVLNDPLSVEFIGKDGNLLTKLGYKSLGWIEDSRYSNSSNSHGCSTYMTAQLHLSVGEKLFGLGERFGPFVKNGQRVECWNEDGGTSSEWTYKNIPFYLSTRGYGVFVDSSSDVVFELQSERTTRVNITVPGEGIRFYIIHGPDPKSILQRYTALTGRPALPPAWTFGLWLTTSFTTNYDISTVSFFLQGMKDREIPLTTFHFDCFWMKGFQWCDFEFDPEYFPDAKKMLKELKSKFNVKICVWINSYIGQESKLFQEADENKYLIRYKQNINNGASYQTDLWQAGMGIVDFTNPEAVKWFQSKLEGLIDLGVDSFKTDFGERIPIKDVVYHSHEDPVAMHNYYALLYNKAVFEVLEKKLGKNNACVFARSTAVGGQQYPVHWGGDCESTFEAMAESLRGGLSLTLSGYGFWSHDIGGFEGDPDPEVYKRWCAFGLLSSHSRLHGSNSYRVPWNFDEEASIVLRKFTKLKISLMPYIYQHAIEAHATGVPVMRASLLEFPGDATAAVVDTQFFLGDSLLVAPVFTGESGIVSFYAPKGKWYGLLDGKVRDSNGQWLDEVHDFKSLPLLVRQNSTFITSGPFAKNDNPVYAWNEGFMVNIHDVASKWKKVSEIPSSVTAGKLDAKVHVEKADGTLRVKTSGKYKAPYFVRILNSKDSSISIIDGKAEQLEDDEFGNRVFETYSDSLAMTLA
ncbi:alpha-glucosidase II [Scheffersomyces xylosifermentans]|uniref:alpha-glucosidase II n=1 Tax=Scheffersomyces xylosifermentans TaxID=1304137 RepID=UPI00315D3CB2